MKKALALVLALVLALSMAVSAFALTELTELTPVLPQGTTLKTLKTIPLAGEENVFIAGEGGTYYVVLDFYTEDGKLIDYKNVTVTANGAVSAKLVEYDPEVYNSIGETYAVVDAEGNPVGGWVNLPYKEAVANCKWANDTNKVTTYKVVCHQNIVLIELVIADNYSASYKEGSLKVTADRSIAGGDWTPVAGKWTIIRDVTIFEYEMVKWAAATKDAELEVGVKGYSDYFTDKYGYDLDANVKYDVAELRQREHATVVSTTAFRAIEGKKLVVEAGDKTVEIASVAKGQKGVNFENYNFAPVIDPTTKELLAYEFGFLGDQVIASDFVITLETGMTYFQLREAFDVKVEEDDIITYYLLKDGKLVQDITVDYMTVDLTKEVKFEIKGSNTTLGQYELVLDVAADAETEENPNTGAESVVGVVAALAVVSVATAAAVSLKK